VLSFGFTAEADVRIASASPLTLDTPAGRIETTASSRRTQPAQRRRCGHAGAGARRLAAAIASGLAGYSGTKGRLQIHACILGATLIDDTYNANPDSVLAAIQVLAERPGTRILVLGDMGELGPDAAELHREVGEKARAAGIERLLCLGEMSQNTARPPSARAPCTSSASRNCWRKSNVRWRRK
jgi:UDP-N-acetylmuramoyl-tripeptide--D-alanyl-D-alanine ligase